MKISERKTDMLNGPLGLKILLFTIPIALSSIVQQLFNAADTSIVGRFSDSNALAAVGTNAEIVALIVTVSSGLSAGVNIIIANRIGKGSTESIPKVVQASVVLAVIIGFIGLFAGLGISGMLLHLIKTPEQIFASAESYLKIYFLGYPFLLLYDFGSAVLRAGGDSRYPFAALLLSGTLNIILNLIFVIFFRMGVVGVAAATDISNAVSAFLVLNRLRKDSVFRLSLGKIKISGSHIAEILKIGVPSAAAGAVFCFANIFVQASVNKFGAVAIAGSTVAINFEYFYYYIITAFGQTAATFTGQNYAAGNINRCKRIFKICLLFSLLFSFSAVALTVVFRNTVSGLFSKELPVIESAGVRIMCILLFEPVCCFYEIPSGILRGTGHAVLPAIDAMAGTCAFRIIYIFTVFRMHPSLETLYYVFPLSWILTIALVWISFFALRPFANKNNAHKNETVLR